LGVCGKSHDTISQFSGHQNGFSVNLHTNSKVGGVAGAGRWPELVSRTFAQKQKKIAKSDILLLLRTTSSSIFVREFLSMYLGLSCHARGRTVTCRVLVFRRHDVNTTCKHVRDANARVSSSLSAHTSTRILESGH
jgi:hypothetical protein